MTYDVGEVVDDMAAFMGILRSMILTKLPPHVVLSRRIAQHIGLDIRGGREWGSVRSECLGPDVIAAVDEWVAARDTPAFIACAVQQHLLSCCTSDELFILPCRRAAALVYAMYNSQLMLDTWSHCTAPDFNRKAEAASKAWLERQARGERT
jgi:hypothetical protein